MAVYQWRGVNSVGRTVKGIKTADNARALRALLKREGVMVTHVTEDAHAEAKSPGEIQVKRLFQRVSTSDIALTTRQLATLLRSGIPLVEALTAVTEQLEQPELQRALVQTRDRVNEGSSLGDALNEHPKLFPRLYISMVAAGEASGTLETVLARLADFLEGQAKIRAKVLGALAYPAVMTVVGTVVVAILMVVVVPKLATTFESFDRALPWFTRVVIFLGELASSVWGLLLVALAAIAIVLFFRWKKTEEGKHKWDTYILTTPIFGKLLLMVAVSRMARTLATLLSSGVPVLRAMEITKNVLGNSELMRVLSEARTSVQEGESLAEPLRRSGRFPAIVTHMIAVGERSGQLEEMLESVANAYEAQVDARIQATTSLLEPLIIVTMGVVVAVILLAILLPLLQIQSFIE